jgi:SAM-dependent methyltransferase
VSTIAPPARPPASAARPRAAGAAVLAIYACAVFSSAFLLFLVQPLFSRMVLPLLGGSPAVWNTCMLFFQAALLGGYLYAHLTSQRFTPRAQALVHLGLLAVAAAVLPVSVSGAAPPGDGSPIGWLLLLMATTVGLPFFVLSGTGPILQRWFTATGHPGAANPYWLYAASNLGSMLALLSYPVWMEPRLRLAEQSATWAVGYGLLGLLLCACAAAVWRARDAAAAAVADAPPVPRRERAVWVGLAFIPSSLLLGVTTYVTTDLTPVPLLWVVPLALYLLTFALVFAPRPLVSHRWMVLSQPAMIAGAVLLYMDGHLREPQLAVPVHLLALFITAMVCHGELSRRRPHPGRLTEFYLWISVGGVLGGIFNVLVAPVLFTRIYEYPLVLALACLARPWPAERTPGSKHASLAVQVALLGAVLYWSTGGTDNPPPTMVAVPIAIVAVHALTLGVGRWPVWLAVCLGGLLLRGIYDEVSSRNTLTTRRTFFGHYRVYVNPADGGYSILTHGSTLHGAQSLDPKRVAEPLTYYVRNGPFGDIFASRPVLTRTTRVAVVGLGTGTTAAYAQPGEDWTFYEIDPGIVEIARDPRYFTYLRNAEAPVHVVLGDARLSLARGTGAPYDLILLDAFSSDAVPVHLLTREALDTYLRRLAPGGRIAYHVSNRYLDLESVVGSLARERGLAVRVGSGPPSRSAEYQQWSTWVVVARSERDLASLGRRDRWRDPKILPGTRPWTDDYSSVLSVFRW